MVCFNEWLFGCIGQSGRAVGKAAGDWTKIGAEACLSHIKEVLDKEARLLAEAILEAKEKIHYCSLCYNLTDRELCPICSNPNRDSSVLCVVEDSRDVMALERANQFHGLYHVLHGAISPMDGIGPEQLKNKRVAAAFAGASGPGSYYCYQHQPLKGKPLPCI